MTVGDILHIKPFIDAACGFARPEVMPCRVIYIHPEKRYYTVEFTSTITGQTWREAFPCRALPESDNTYSLGRHVPRGARHNGRKL